MTTKDKEQALQDRLDVFADTPEIIDMLKGAADAVVGGPQDKHRYSIMETIVHIQGLYDLAKEMLQEIKANAKEKQ